MRRSFNLAKLPSGIPGLGSARGTPQRVSRVVLGILILANVAAFFLFVKPIGGSAEDLDRELRRMQAELRKEQQDLLRVGAVVKKMELARQQQEAFMKGHFMERRTASSTILSEIGNSARQAGLTPKEHAFVIEPVEGSEHLGMMTITANYEGSYGDLVKFVNLVDRSSRFLIIDSIQAAPQQQAGRLAARFRMNTFVREEDMRARGMQ